MIAVKTVKTVKTKFERLYTNTAVYRTILGYGVTNETLRLNRFITNRYNIIKSNFKVTYIAVSEDGFCFLGTYAEISRCTRPMFKESSS